MHMEDEVNKKAITEIKSELTKLLILILVVAFLVIMQGWLIQTLWLWFMVGAFALPKLSITQAIGLSVFVYAFETSPNKDNKEESIYDLCKKAIKQKVVKCASLLLLGWIVLQFL